MALKLIHICFGGPERTITDANGKTWRFEDHHYFGPVVLNVRTGETLANVPGPRSPFWKAWKLWNEQGKRVTDDGRCVTD